MATARKAPAKSAPKPAGTAPAKPTKKAAGSKTTQAKPKTAPTEVSVADYLAELPATVRSDCERLDAWMSAAVGAPGKLYGSSIVGYGSKLIRYAGGREAPWMKLGFASRAQSLVLYGVVETATPELLEALGKHKTGKGCLYIKGVDDIDTASLKQLLALAAAGGD